MICGHPVNCLQPPNGPDQIGHEEMVEQAVEQAVQQAVQSLHLPLGKTEQWLS